MTKEQTVQIIQDMELNEFDNPVLCEEAISMAIQALKNSGGWISVKDRLPCDGVFVLVCNDDGHMMIAKYESELVRWEYKYTNYDHDVWDDDEQGPVCYWMPLPEPPKEE